MKRLLVIITAIFALISLSSYASFAQNTSCRVHGLSDNSVVVTVNTPFVKSSHTAPPYITVKLSLNKTVSTEVGISIKVKKDKTNITNETIYIQPNKKNSGDIQIAVDEADVYYSVSISYASCTQQQ